MLRASKYRLRFNRKRPTRKSAPERNQQFTKINHLKAPEGIVRAARSAGHQRGCQEARARRPVQEPGQRVAQGAGRRQHVRLSQRRGRRRDPYGVYDVTRGDGFVVVGTSHNTAAFAANADPPVVASCRTPRVLRRALVLIFADSGSSNGVNAHGWKEGLQQIANETGLRITVAHYPTGASKWNPVEHRLFGPISINWASEPLADYTTICQRIRHTRARSGGRCRVVLDRRDWPTKKELKEAGEEATVPACVRIRRGTVLPRLN
jgi:Rhodopirellula transposase DDE domain